MVGIGLWCNRGSTKPNMTIDEGGYSSTLDTMFVVEFLVINCKLIRAFLCRDSSFTPTRRKMSSNIIILPFLRGPCRWSRRPGQPRRLRNLVSVCFALFVVDA